MTNKKLTGRGGPGRGQGRPPGAKNKKKLASTVAITARVLPETLEWINGKPMSQGKVIDELVKNAKK